MSTPKGDYIPINTIEDIDPQNITIRDLNKRYIDRDGNRYATRFNLQNRKVEVVQIVKGMHEAKRIQQQRMIDRSRPTGSSGPAMDDGANDIEDFEDSTPTAAPAAPVAEESAPPADEFDSVDTSESAGFDADAVAPFIEQQFIEEVEADFERIKQRQIGVINNLKNSGAFVGPLDDRLGHIIREMETDAWGKCEAAINYSKELRSYPRPVSYYLTKLGSEHKARVEAQTEDHRKLELIRRWELQRAFQEAYTEVQAAAQLAQGLLDAIGSEQRDALGGTAKQQLEDAGTSLEFMQSEIMEKLKKIQHWRHRYGS